MKSLWTSKTIIFNGLTLAVAALTAIAGHELVAANPRTAAWVVSAIGFIGIVLRLLTDKPVGLP